MAGDRKKNIPPKQQYAKQAQNCAKKQKATIPNWAPYAVVILTAIVYSRVSSLNFASWDDDTYILKNDFIRDFSFTGIKAIFSSFYFANYHPFTTLTFLIEYTLYGLNPVLYHVVNVLFHLLNTFLVYKLVEKLSNDRITALIVSLLFAVHPMHVESVAWISERKDVLYTFFYIISLLAYLRYLTAERKTKYYAATLLLFICSLLSKSAAVTLPVLLFVVDFYKGRKYQWKMVLEKIPFLALSVLFGILAIQSQMSTESINDLSLSFSFLDRLFLFTYAFSFYLVKMLIPIQMSAMHYFPVTNGGALPWMYYASLPFLLIIAWLVIRSSKFRKEIVFGFAFFAVCISVMLPIVPVGFALTAERYTYVAYTGLFFIAASLIVQIGDKQKRSLAYIITGVYIALISYQTWDRIGLWKNGNTLFSDVIKKYPEIFHGYWIRGNVKNNDAELDEANKDALLKDALQDYNAALQRRPNFAFGLVNRADVENKLFDYKAAIKDLNLAIKLDSGIGEAYNNRGMSYDGLGDTASAMKDYNTAIRIKPEMEKAYNNRGVLKAAKSCPKEALIDLNKAVTLEPSDGEAFSNRANVKAMVNDFQGALEDYSLSLKYKPNDKVVYYNRGISRLNMKDTTGACKDWEKALQLGNEAAKETLNHFCK